MKNILLITLFFIIISIVGYSQKDSNAKAQSITDKELNLELTKILLEIPKIKTILITKSYNNTDAIFIFCDSRFFDKEMFDTTLSIPFYIWNKETLFFNNISHWFIPVSIEKSDDTITYAFKIGSSSSKKTHSGQVKFIKTNNKWIVKTLKIK